MREYCNSVCVCVSIYILVGTHTHTHKYAVIKSIKCQRLEIELTEKSWTLKLTHYLTEGLTETVGDELFPRTMPGDPCNEELAPELGSIEPMAPWFGRDKPVAWEPW